MNATIKFIPPQRRAYSGRRARRQAFYGRMRLARSLNRIVAGIFPNIGPTMERMFRDSIVGGTGIVEIWQPDPGEPYQVRHVSPSDFGVNMTIDPPGLQEARNQAMRDLLDTLAFGYAAPR